MVINYKKLNPNGFYLLKYLNDETIRFIILYGGSSSGKSYSVAQTILIQTLQDGENTLVMRKVGASILKTIYEDYKVAAAGLGISHLFKFQQNTIKCLVNGAKIDFSGLDDPEKIKGISNYKRVQLEEWSEFEHPDFKQLRKRLRGKKGQQIICTFNPISESHWIKKEFIDKDKWHDVPMSVTIAGKELPKELTKVKSVKKNAPRQILNLRTKQIEEQAPNTVIIQSTYLNNFWVVGSPDGTYGFYDEQCVADFEYDRVHDPDYYNVYALGEWGVIRTGSEFFGSFNRGKHSGEHKYIPDLPIHISVDNNVLPYISVSYWQVDFTTGIKVWQFHETCAESPNNTVKKSSKLVAKYLKDIRYSDKVYLHGDASTKAANSIDDEKRSWMDLFIDTLQKEGFEIEDKVGNKNPSVAMTGEFINAIFDCTVPGIEIYIDESCSVSIEDYMSVQKDANGAILKTKVKNKTTLQTYEEHGHLSDTFRYVVVDLCNEQYTEFSNRRKRNLYGGKGMLGFFNPEAQNVYSQRLVYVMPNVDGTFVLVQASRCDDKWHLTDALFRETSSIEEIKTACLEHKANTCLFECSSAYYQTVRELREIVKDTEVRVKKEFADVDKRIAATSDFIRNNFLLSPKMLEESQDYSDFITNLMDYNINSENKSASIILSGLAYHIIKSFPESSAA
ncbi:PBSX family phage terminase large subunit [Bacteroides thetaiotaomicron]|uniref:PBSX family phage terminase large subunit n=5 Tax=Bacteroides TaxID=816 RepID=A0AAW6HNS7_BACOV|nr:MULTISPECIES: PBSX family phage terminase large subunit [Bacteroides]MDC2173990.1 PBSX family phage terminase large subunit [Bacteroides thetaiotaomicron]MDC2189439.1 PBSX family phage terminase large subunit [Bacteroides thetaiotaomicron]MDC2709812.1 PBSX family phage terminase large subunit [Bacteroides ovatus]MDC2745380.1 PBSX family phage terminase large subunit [Bacteroides ovatus]